MALVIDEYCTECSKTQTHTNGKCNVCEDRKFREKMGIWQSKTTEEKLLDIHKRLLKLEEDPPTY